MLKRLNPSVIVGLIWLTILFIGFGIPNYSFGSETGWARTPDRPNQWQKEIGEKKGDAVLKVEYGHGPSPMYIYQARCEGTSLEYRTVAWRKGETGARGFGCGGKRHHHIIGTHALEKQGGELPPELLKELGRPRPQRERAPRP